MMNISFKSFESYSEHFQQNKIQRSKIKYPREDTDKIYKFIGIGFLKMILKIL